MQNGALITRIKEERPRNTRKYRKVKDSVPFSVFRVFRGQKLLLFAFIRGRSLLLSWDLAQQTVRRKLRYRPRDSEAANFHRQHVDCHRDWQSVNR
jgi:hypothetical protein